MKNGQRRGVSLWSGCREPGEPVSVNRVDPVTGACLISPTTINVLIDRRITNLAEVRTSGLDATLNYRVDVNSRSGALDLGFSATYLFNNEQVLSPNTPARDIINTQYNPLHLRLRSSAIWTQQNWSIGAFVNYANRYDNVRPATPAKVASWTTVDVNARYNFSQSWLKGSALMLNIQNAFDANPPALVDPTIPANSARTGYDAANADPIGRVFALTVLKHW